MLNTRAQRAIQKNRFVALKDYGFAQTINYAGKDREMFLKMCKRIVKYIEAKAFVDGKSVGVQNYIDSRKGIRGKQKSNEK